MDDLNNIAVANGRQGAQIDDSVQGQKFIRSKNIGQGYTRGIDDKLCKQCRNISYL